MLKIPAVLTVHPVLRNFILGLPARMALKKSAKTWGAMPVDPFEVAVYNQLIDLSKKA